MWHETWPLSFRCRPFAVLQRLRKTFRKFLAGNEVACYVLPYLRRNRLDPFASVYFNLNRGILTGNDSLPLTFHWLYSWWSQLTTTCRCHQVRHPQRDLRFSQWCCRIGKCVNVTLDEWFAMFRYIVSLSSWRSSSARRLNAWPWRRRHYYSLNPVGLLGTSRRSRLEVIVPVRAQIASRYQNCSTG